MFFGHEVKANQNKATSLTMDNDIKLSQAVLDPASKGKKIDPVTLVAEVEGKSFILAVLDPSQSWQCPLDLMLAAGTDVKFYLRGQGCVHLTGYEFRDDDFEMSMSSDEEEEELEDANKFKQAVKKIKTKNSPAKTNGVKSNNKPKLTVKGDDDDSDDDEDLSFGSEEEDLDDSDLESSSSDAMDHDFKDMNGDSDDDDDDEDDEEKDDDEDSDEEESDSDSS